MGWASGTYTKGNAATGGWTGDATNGIGIEAGRHDTQDNDFATGINNCLTKDGQNNPTANLPMGGYKHTNVAAASARNEYVTLGQLQDGAVIWCGTSSGSANAQTLTPSPAITAYAAGQVFRFIAGFTSTSALTLQVSGIAGPKTCLAKNSLLPFSTLSFLLAGKTYEALYDGTNFLIADLLDLGSYTNDPGAARVKLVKSRGVTAGSNVIVQNGDGLGQIDFYGANGTGFTRGAFINAVVDGTPGATNDMPTAVVIATTPDGSGTPLERLRIDSGGRAQYGGTPPGSYSQFDIFSTATTRRALTAYSIASADLSTPAIAAVKWDNDTTTSNRFVQFWVNNGLTQSGGIAANGASQATFVSISDARLKENIVDLPSQLTNVMSLRPVEYDYKDGSGHQVGFLAQEVKAIYPDLVSEDSDGYYNLSGLGKNEARLIKAFQEFAQLTQGTIAALETRIAELENA